MAESKITRLQLEKRHTCSEERKNYYDDFNSRVFFPHSKLLYLKQLQSQKKKLLHQTIKTITANQCQTVKNSKIKSQTVKLKLQKILKKQYSPIHSETAQQSQKSKRTKSLFFHNYKLNKSKKQLEDLSKMSMIEFTKKQDKELEQINKKGTFIIKQIKLVNNNKINSPLSTTKRSLIRHQNQQKSFYKQDHMLKSFQNSFSPPKSPNKPQKVRVIQFFQRYDDNWYQKQKQDVDQQTKLTNSFFKVKPRAKLSLNIRNRQQIYQPWQHNGQNNVLQAQQF